MEKASQGKIFFAHTKPIKMLSIKTNLLLDVTGKHDSLSKVFQSENIVKSDSKSRVVNGKRAVLAMTYRDNKYIYGLSICSELDRFDKNIGRELAVNRMNQEFRSIKEEDLSFFFSHFEKEKSTTLSENQKIKLILGRVAEKVSNNLMSGKYERLLEAHRKGRIKEE